LNISFEEFRKIVKGRDAIVTQRGENYYIIVHPYLLPCKKDGENRFICLTINFNMISELDRIVTKRSYEVKIANIYAKKEWKKELFCQQPS